MHISKQHVNSSHDVVQQFSQLSIKESSPIGSDWRPSTTFVGVDAILIDVGWLQIVESVESIPILISIGYAMMVSVAINGRHVVYLCMRLEPQRFECNAHLKKKKLETSSSHWYHGHSTTTYLLFTRLQCTALDSFGNIRYMPPYWNDSHSIQRRAMNL